MEHLKNGILVHQKIYIEKVLKRFSLDHARPLSSPMVVRSLDVDKDPFRHRENDEEIIGPEVPYLSAIGALMNLASHTRPAISFSVNLLARFSSCPTRRHWNGIKHLQATSSNHAEILAIHEASHECVWLRYVIQHIREDYGLSTGKEAPTVMYEDNTTCIAQLKDGYIKGDKTKHILPKFFFTHELQKNGDVQVLQNRSSENLTDLFTKAIPTATFKKLVYYIGLRRLKDLKLCNHEGE
ncbi:uncharacterized protein [Spinacia oleracea]|uniref:Reverse transcriptase Ty1/copia-type domain-containing protein n=1 Tax=Spinacia oleracea TaxID=3562 RepID=A0A9R0JLE2_SPIOL|nr:uncharacterized protein LOC110778783 [Spinacia oleracea]